MTFAVYVSPDSFSQDRERREKAERQRLEREALLEKIRMEKARLPALFNHLRIYTSPSTGRMIASSVDYMILANHCTLNWINFI